MKSSNRSLFLCALLSFVFAFGILPPETQAARKKPSASARSHKKAENRRAPSGEEDDAEDGGKEAAANGKTGGQECAATFLMEPSTGTVIQETNADQPLAPASMTKLMLSYVVLKRISEGSIKETDMITTSAHASRIGGSQVYLKEGEQFTLKDLLSAVMIQSANDAATAIAEHIGGSTEGFVEMMNQEAKALGMEGADFHSPHGLPPSEGQEVDRVSARNMAKLGQALMKEFPSILELTKQTDADFRGGEFHMSNHNHLLRNFPGCDGLKTGFFNQAGFNVTATATRNGVRMLAVAMNCNSRKGRDKEVAKLLSTGLAQYRPVTIASKTNSLGEMIAVKGGEKDLIAAYPANDLTAVVRVGEEKNVTKKVELCQGLPAPVQANTKCGTMAAYLGDRELGRVDLIANENVQQMGRLGKMRARLGF